MKELIADVRENYRLREDLLRAEGNLTRQIKSICHRMCGEDLAAGQQLYKDLMRGAEGERVLSAWKAARALIDARTVLKPHLKSVDASLRAMGRELPCAERFESVRGLTVLGLTLLVGACGNPSEYRTDACLWKRMGVGIMPDGKRQRLVSSRGKKGKAAEEAKQRAIESGYSPGRRGLLYKVTNPLILRGKNPYRDTYDRQKARLAELHPDWTKAHLHNAAHRLTSKALLRDLRRWWIAETRH